MTQRLELAAYLGHAPSAKATGVRAGRKRGLRAWLDAAPGAAPPPPAPAPDPRDARTAYLRSLEGEVRGIDAGLEAQLAEALGDPTTLALSNLAQRVSSKDVASKFPRALAVMGELIALTTDTMEVAEEPTPPLSEVHQRAGIAAARALLGPPSEDLRSRVARDLAALRAATGRTWAWYRDLEVAVDAELRLAAAELQLLRHPSRLVEALSEVKDRADAGPRGWRAAAAVHAAAWGNSAELDEVLRLATRALGALGVREAVRAELLAWALGDDPVAARVAPLLASLGEGADT